MSEEAIVPDEFITVPLVRRCQVCHKSRVINMPEDAYNKYIAGANIQDAWPGSSSDEREEVMTGIHPECWDNLFSDAMKE